MFAVVDHLINKKISEIPSHCIMFLQMQIRLNVPFTQKITSYPITENVMIRYFQNCVVPKLNQYPHDFICRKNILCIC